MRPCEDVIVTVNLFEPDCSYDMEIPSFMSIRELKKKLVETLRLMGVRGFTSTSSIDLFSNDLKLKDEATLAQHGIWDGSIVDVKINRTR